MYDKFYVLNAMESQVSSLPKSATASDPDLEQ